MKKRERERENERVPWNTGWVPATESATLYRIGCAHISNTVSLSTTSFKIISGSNMEPKWLWLGGRTSWNGSEPELVSSEAGAGVGGSKMPGGGDVLLRMNCCVRD